MQTIARQYTGASPFAEVWFIEFTFGDQGFWCRYTIKDGHASSQADTWAMWFGTDGVQASRDPHDLAGLTGEIFELGEHRLTRDRAVGSAGNISWDLAIEDGGLVHTHTPKAFGRLKGMRHYEPAMLDLSCSGTVTVDGTVHAVSDGRGVMGHIWGKSTRTNEIAWLHCNTFAEQPAVFEALSAQLKFGPVKTPILASIGLHVDGRHYSFSTVKHWFRNVSRFEKDSWHFEARDGSVRLVGDVRHPDQVTRLHYKQHDGSDLYCVNGRFSPLTLHLTDPDNQVDMRLSSDSCAFERQSRRPLGGPLHLN